jgi:hypothetical protein
MTRVSAGSRWFNPTGTVIVPFESLNGKEAARRTAARRGRGRSRSRAFGLQMSREELPTSPLPSTQIDGSGKVCVAWEDCRFRKNCTSNDIVLSSSTDGVSWSPVASVPIDSVTSGGDHFIPGLAVDRHTSGSNAHLALSYYFYPAATCGRGKLTAGYISSPDGGAHWGDPHERRPLDPDTAGAGT